VQANENMQDGWMLIDSERSQILSQQVAMQLRGLDVLKGGIRRGSSRSCLDTLLYIGNSEPN
jgi:hypothetical protein